MEIAATGLNGSERDFASLMEFKNSVTQDPLVVLYTWKSLHGVIPLQLANLSFLHYLDLSFNRIGDQIPSALGCLRRLHFLYLHANLLEGSVPHSLSNLRNLKVGLKIKEVEATQAPQSGGNLVPNYVKRKVEVVKEGRIPQLERDHVVQTPVSQIHFHNTPFFSVAADARPIAKVQALLPGVQSTRGSYVTQFLNSIREAKSLTLPFKLVAATSLGLSFTTANKHSN
ncbi:hypothetical protein SUGI_0577650 [Cryptomeria japonica]|nr:hypothetical protein SUGI_0577650 [Cryptomeria japonica]